MQHTHRTWKSLFVVVRLFLTPWIRVLEKVVNSRSASQEIVRLLWNQEFDYSLHKSPLPVPIVSQVNVVKDVLRKNKIILSEVKGLAVILRICHIHYFIRKTGIRNFAYKRLKYVVKHSMHYTTHEFRKVSYENCFIT
jgi:hypothetical protein